MAPGLEIAGIAAVAIFAIRQAFEVANVVRNRKNNRCGASDEQGQRIARIEGQLDSELAGIHRELATIRGQLAVMGRLEQARNSQAP